MSKIVEIQLKFDEELHGALKERFSDLKDFRILSKSLDARGAPRGKPPRFHYRIEVIGSHEEFSKQELNFEKKQLKSKPLIIGAGPAGLFAALRFSEYEIPTTVIERGDMANSRMLYISKYWKKGILNTENNVCFGEGGAGLFSDGKLITRIKSSHIKYVMRKFVEFGAPKEVEYLANPHLGSNKIRKIISLVTDQLKSRGSEVIYNNKATEFIFDKNKIIGVKLSNGESLYSDYIILACGHSASDIYTHLSEKKVAMGPKDFAVGVRVEHPRKQIDNIQYGQFSLSGELGAARYRLSYHDKLTDKGTYSFCMCPGGYVLSSGTDVDGIVSNGMSNYSRSSPWSNAALVVTVKKGEDFDEDDIMAGHRFQTMIEKKAFDLSKKYSDGKSLPAITIKEFIDGQMNDKELPKNSCPSGLFKADFNQIFPSFIIEHLKKSLIDFDKKMPGFIAESGILIAPETRTSSPISICRDKKTLESTSHQGLYPCGEGAGHAGGITSAAVDGIKVAESIISSLSV